MFDSQKIRSAKEKIAAAILEQIADGAQSKELKDAFACGQFLKVPEIKQRGFHGTAAAIRVLAGFDDKYNEQLRKLIKYIENIDNYETEISIPGLSRDKNNIIKNAEILYSLSYIQSGTANTEALKDSIYKKLIACKNNDGGWAFFTDVKDESDIYSTSLVYLALRRHNYNNLAKTLDYLKNELNEIKNEKIPDPTTFSKICFVLYALVKVKLHKSGKENKNLIVDIFKKLWESEHCILISDFEQNIEYPDKERHYYVRIPWQLYLISIANDILPRYFAKKQSLARLNSVLNSIIDVKGFVYKQSGKNIASRTYSIVFEVLTNVEETFKLNFRFYFNNGIDQLRTFLGNRILRNIVSTISFIIILIIIYLAIKNNQIKIHDLAPSILASLLIILFTFGKTK